MANNHCKFQVRMNNKILILKRLTKYQQLVSIIKNKFDIELFKLSYFDKEKD